MYPYSIQSIRQGCFTEWKTNPTPDLKEQDWNPTMTHSSIFGSDSGMVYLGMNEIIVSWPAQSLGISSHAAGVSRVLMKQTVNCCSLKPGTFGHVTSNLIFPQFTMWSICVGWPLLTEPLPALQGTHAADRGIREHTLTVLYQVHKVKFHHSGLAKKSLLRLRLQPSPRAGFSFNGGKSSAYTESQVHKDVVPVCSPSLKLLQM